MCGEGDIPHDFVNGIILFAGSTGAMQCVGTVVVAASSSSLSASFSSCGGGAAAAAAAFRSW